MRVCAMYRTAPRGRAVSRRRGGVRMGMREDLLLVLDTRAYTSLVCGAAGRGPRADRECIW